MAEALGIASSIIAVVDLSAKVINWCVRYAQDVSHAKEDKKRLVEELTRLNLVSVNARNLLDGPHGSRLKASHALYVATVNSQSQLKSIERQLAKRNGQDKVSFEALKWPFKSKDVQLVIQDLDRCTKAIYLALEVDQTSILLDVDHKIALDMLPVAEGASFDSHAEEHNPTCLPNTRKELLRDIRCWIDDDTSKTIFWLNGMAGTGKSTISRTVAQARSRRGNLGASFFFKRGEMDRANLNKLMSTLVYQLSLSIPEAAFFVKKALDDNPAIVRKSLKEQFEKLIQEPLSEAAASAKELSPVVIVIDALDECDQEADIRLLINIFSQAKTSLPHLRVFLTSRPELPIRLGFKEAQGSYQGLVLHEVPVQVVEHDIFVFLNDEFRKIRHDFNLTVCDERKLPSDWPGGLTLQRLTQMAVPLFIFAATVCRFVGDRNRNSPSIQLRKVLDYQSKGHVSQLDLTYGPALHSLIGGVSGDDKKQIINDFKTIIGGIVMLADPLSARALSQLLEVDPEVVDNRLDTLHSVLNIPPTQDAPVRLLHLSFRDYLIKEESEFRVDERYTHQTLAKHCLRIMRGALRKNICGLSFPAMRRSSVDSGHLEKRMPSQLQYACMHWVYHQTSGKPEPSDDKDVYGFLTTHFLHWLEAMSLLGRVKKCLDALRSLARWLKDREDVRLSSFVADAVRFVQTYSSVIAEAPLQIYCCLAFTPSKSIVRRTFNHAIPRWIRNLPKVEENWDACLLTLEGHSLAVRSVVFSHDSKKLASASDDKTIRIWNAETGECEQALKGHSDSIRSVVFSYDSKKLASASDDKTIRIWNAETGECEQALKGHSDGIRSVVFSHDSKKLASASDDKTIRIWNAETGECEQELKGHSDSIRLVMFSYDSKKVASGSFDKTIRIWNVETGKSELVLKCYSDYAMSIMFSHDSKKVASASNDKTIRIWNAETGECEQVLKGFNSWVNSVVFSHDLKKVASASNNEAIRIWDAKTGKCEQVLKGHGGSINSVVFSHDVKKVASGSSDKIIRIWNAEIGGCERVLKGHCNYVWSVVFSHDLKKVASGSYDQTIRIWNAKTGECEQVLEGHSKRVNSVVFSYDSKKVASASNDEAIRIWDAKTGKCEQVLKGHSNSINSVAFSHNSKKVASASDDKIVRIWNTETGRCERVLEGHSDVVRSVAFSHTSKKVVSASYDKTIRIWDTETGECEQELKGHGGLVNSVVFSHNSKKVASGCSDRTIRIWDAEIGRCEDVISLDRYADVLSLEPDEHRIVTNRGTFALTGGSQSFAGSPTGRRSSKVATLACIDDTWVTTAGKDLLWLPPECRDGKVAVSGSTVVIGCRSGRFVLLEISTAEVEQWTDA